MPQTPARKDAALTYLYEVDNCPMPWIAVLLKMTERKVRRRRDQLRLRRPANYRDDWATPPPDSDCEPTECGVGSAAKVEEMAARYQRGEEIMSDDDSPDCKGGFSLWSKQELERERKESEDELS